ncbi:hypothetical protein [Pseudofulvibacter geojedonensis]|uniref:SGNH hydrolase-type esterase domain-containing protein n=1 Tax=Pseudofulvibacter geojedonensis TaxID=1123758 RepID=A0ABW3I6H3_9FLAO
MRKFVTRLILFFFVVFLINQGANWILEKPVRNAIKNKTHKKFLKWNDIQNTENKYDIIFLGSSRGYCAYNPIIIDSITNSNSYNMCTGSQNITESYYLLKEILEHQKPKVVFFDLFYNSIKSSPDYYHILSNARFLSTHNKLDLIINGFGFDGVVNYTFPLISQKPYFKNSLLNSFNDTVAVTKSNWTKGFLNSKEVVSDASIKNFSKISHFKDLKKEKKQLIYSLNLIANLCQESNVKFICLRAPYPNSRLQMSKETDLITTTLYQQACTELSIPFYDFNYLDNTNYQDSYFTDLHHMNTNGANAVSNVLGHLINNSIFSE